MKIKILIFLFICSLSVFSQDDKRKFKIEYINMTSFSVTKNTESYFSNYASTESRETTNGFGLDINSIHGIKFFNHIAISAGLSIDWNINKTFLSTPAIIDLRYFSSKTNDNSMFVYLQTGKNIKWSDSFDGNGTSSKLGIGAIFDIDEDVSYYIEIFKKSKVIEISNSTDKGTYNVNGFGISIGVMFN